MSKIIDCPLFSLVESLSLSPFQHGALFLLYFFYNNYLMTFSMSIFECVCEREKIEYSIQQFHCFRVNGPCTHFSYRSCSLLFIDFYEQMKVRGTLSEELHCTRPMSSLHLCLVPPRELYHGKQHRKVIKIE